MNLPKYQCYEPSGYHSPDQYNLGNGYYWCIENIRGLGFGYTGWYQNLSGEYEPDDYYNTSLIFIL